MIISSIVAGIGDSIGGKVIEYLKSHQEQVQFEQMQSEILEGWVYKIRIAIRDAHQKAGVSLEVHQEVMKVVEEVVAREFDTKKL